MGIPSRPIVQHQGPANHCVINGRQLGWLSCSAYSMAMGIDRSTLGAKRPTGCQVRSHTGDTSGGLTLTQVAASAAVYGVHVDLYQGNGACSPVFAARQCRAGRGFCLQGSTGVLVHTKFRSTGGPVDHTIWVNEVKGGTLDAPQYALVYDPAADGTNGHASSPGWWPWSLVKSFAANLHPWNDRRILGPGRFYAAFLPDTEAHAHLKWAAVHTKPFPDHMLINPPAGKRINVRSRPDRINAADVVTTLPLNAPFTAYQVTSKGIAPNGSTSHVWYGDHNGNQWVHITGLKGIGGAS